MALFDPERKRIVVRVVYDGPGHAGKTTNLQRLCKSYAAWRRSDLVSPNTLGERTQFFDWLEVDGGLMSGYPVRAQLLTVPGQVELALRRQFVIEGADVVVFVADSQPEAVDEARSFYAQLCEQIAGFGHPVPIIFQANKQDVRGALKPRELARRVSEGLLRPTQIRGSVASNNRGVKQTLMLALRMATEQLRKQWSGEDPRSKIGEVGDAATTLAALEHREAALAEGRPIQLQPTLPHPELPPEQIWPPSSGARLLAELEGRPLLTRSFADHPERRCYEVETSRGRWLLSTATDRLYRDLDEAGRALAQLGSRLVALGSWLPEPCVLATVADPEGHGAWLWFLEPALPSLAEQLDAPLRRTRVERLEQQTRRRDALLRFAEVAIGAEALAERDQLCVELEPGNFALQRGERPRTRYIGTQLGDGLAAGETLDIAGPVLALAARFEAEETTLADLAEVLCMGLHQVPQAPERRSSLRAAFARVELEDHPNTRRLRDAACMVLRRPAPATEPATGPAPGLEFSAEL